MEDCALLLGVIAGQDPRDALTTRRPVPDYRAALTGEVRGLRVGVIRELLDGGETDPEMRDAVRAAVGVLAKLGAEVAEVSLPLVPRAGAAFMAICDSEGAGLHLPWLRHRAAEYDEGTRRRLLAAALLPAVLLQKAQHARALIRQQVLDALERHDVLVAPTSHRPAPPIASFTAPITSTREAAARFFTRRSFTTPAALAGAPALAVPCGFSTAGLPLSLQIIGRPFADATVLRRGPRLRAGHRLAPAPATAAGSLRGGRGPRRWLSSPKTRCARWPRRSSCRSRPRTPSRSRIASTRSSRRWRRWPTCRPAAPTRSPPPSIPTAPDHPPRQPRATCVAPGLGRERQDDQIALAARLTVSASRAALKAKATIPWPATRRRICLLVTLTSETCEVMPITKEK